MYFSLHRVYSPLSKCHESCGKQCVKTCADCLFADFDGSRTTGVYSGATANFVSCEFTNNTLFSDQGDSSVIEADGYDEYDYENDGDSLVRLQGCTFSGNTPETTPVLLADDAGICSLICACHGGEDLSSVCVSCLGRIGYHPLYRFLDTTPLFLETPKTQKIILLVQLYVL